MITFDLAAHSVRDLNQRLQSLPPDTNERAWRVLNPKGAHAVVAGLDQPIAVEIDGHCGVGVAENIMSGEVRVKGNASQSAGASGHGGLLVIEGDASARCGISMKGVDIVVGGSVGHLSAFMAQTGSLVVCGDAGQSLGDSIYEAKLYVQGKVESLGADCVEKRMTEHHLAKLARLLARAGIAADARNFRRYGSARKLYNFHVDHADSY